jgi:hypothetical protein
MATNAYEKKTRTVSIGVDVYLWLENNAMRNGSHVAKEVVRCITFYRRYCKFEKAIEKQYYEYAKKKAKDADAKREAALAAPDPNLIGHNIELPTIQCPICTRYFYKDEIKKCKGCGDRFCGHCRDNHVLTCEQYDIGF